MMVTGAFAWFSTEESFPTTALVAAEFSISVTDSNGNAVLTPYVTPLAHGDLHSFFVTSSGTASLGCCRIVIEDSGGLREFYSSEIERGSGLVINIKATRDCRIYFYPSWEKDETRQTNYFHHSSTPYFEYTVPANCTLDALCEYYGVSPSDVCTFNAILDIEEGMTVKIPGSSDLPEYVPFAESEETSPTHVVESGETLSEIAKEYDTTVEEISEINSIENPSNIITGTELIIPVQQTSLEQTSSEEPLKNEVTEE